MIRWVTSWLIVFMGGLTFMAHAQDFDSSNFEAFVEDTMSASNVPGLAVIIFENNVTIYENSFGVTDTDSTPVTLDTPFQLGSVSKAFSDQ